MGKRDGARFVNKEIYQRVNFLFQAAKLVLRQDPTNFDLCKYYISTMLMVAEKHVIRVHPKIKRTFCKCCNVLLVSGLSCRIRCRSQNEKHTVITCLLCGTIKRFMWRKDHHLWIDRPEAWLATADRPDKKTGVVQCHSLATADRPDKKTGVVQCPSLATADRSDKKL